MLSEWLLDPDGNAIDAITWSTLRMDRSKVLVAEDGVPLPDGLRGWLVTLWAGTVPNCGCHDNYGTIVQGARRQFIADLEPYRTREQAIAGHLRHLAALRGDLATPTAPGDL